MALITALIASAFLPSLLQAVAAGTTVAQVAQVYHGHIPASSFHRLQVGDQPGEASACVSDTNTGGTEGAGLGCYVDISPAEAFNPLGVQHTVTFTCENSAQSLTFSTGTQPALPAGCYNVTASVEDSTTGNASTFDAATCANVRVPITSATINCSGDQNPICAVGAAGPGGGNCQLQPCPSGFTLTDTLCTAPPSASGTCPTNSTAVDNFSGSVAYCVAPTSTSAAASNQVVLAINSSAPHVYYIQVNGYIGTTADGTCPAGTTLVNSVPLQASDGASAIVATACQFSVRAEKKYIEATSIKILPIGTCTGTLIASVTNANFVTPCFFKLKAIGTVILKSGVNCNNGTEPPDGASAIPAGFLPDPVTLINPVYQCAGDTLSVIDVGVPGIQLNLASTNGSFNPVCIPVSRAEALLTTPTPTPSVSPTPTITPLPSPTPGPGTPIPSPTPIPTPAPYQQPAACTESLGGSAPIQTTVSSVGLAGSPVGLAGSESVAIAASIVAPPIPGQDVILQGNLLLSGSGASGHTMYGTIYYPTGTVFCDTGITDVSGNASCTETPTPTSGLKFPQYVPTDISFIENCEEYGIHSYFVDPRVSPPLASATFGDPFCVIPTAFGTLSIQATFSSSVNTQPSLSTGNVPLGQVLYATPSPTPATPLPVPSLTIPVSGIALPTSTAIGSVTPAVTPTNTPVPSSTPTPVPTATSTLLPTATPTRTPVAVLHFNVDAARITKPKLESKRQGMDQVTPGEKTSLVVYYTIKSMPKPVRRVTRYQIKDATGHVIFDVTFPPGTESKPGQYARYTTYTVPLSLSFGVYSYRATLTLGTRSEGRTWVFAVVRPSNSVSALSAGSTLDTRAY